MNDETARRRAFALALVALEALPEGERPTELMKRFRELLTRPGLQGSHPSIMFAEAKRLLRPLALRALQQAQAYAYTDSETAAGESFPRVSALGQNALGCINRGVG